MTIDINYFPLFSVSNIFATGSRHICNPPVMDTDEDFIVLAEDLKSTGSFLVSNGWQPSIADEDMLDEYGMDFYSYRKGDINLIVTADAQFYKASYHAHVLAKRLNLLNKQDRADLFELARHGEFNH